MLDTSLLQLSALSAVVLTAIYLYFRASYSYWQKRGVPSLKATPPFGNLGKAMLPGKNSRQVINDLYKEFEGHKFAGLYNFTTPALLLRDPELIKTVLVKDFDKFHSRGVIIDEEKEPLEANLASLSGSKWRNLRVKLTPTFTSGKMKMMFGTLAECGKELQLCLEPLASKGETIEVKDVLARYSTDIIASCAFGIQCNSLKNPDAEFRNWGRKIFEPTFKTRLVRTIDLALSSSPRFLRTRTSPKDVDTYFMNMVTDTVEYREKNDLKRNDFMQLLIQLKNKTLGVAEAEDATLQNLDIDDLKSNAPFGKINQYIHFQKHSNFKPATMNTRAFKKIRLL
jgi:cytochrome P450 family 6